VDLKAVPQVAVQKQAAQPEKPALIPYCFAIPDVATADGLASLFDAGKTAFYW
jgi:hypothetical protein